MASSSRTQLQPLSGEQQEHIIKQRMQVDERSLRRLVKKLTLLLGSTSAESVSTARLSFQAELEAFRLQLLRLSSIARGTCEVEISSYTRELSEIEQEQHRTQDRIAALKQRLEDVRRERQNKLEYDTVAAEIVTLPTRAELNESLQRLGEQLQSVRAENAKYVDMSRDAAARMGVVMRDVEALRNDVGYEVGERERREVERADGDADAEAGGDDASESGRKERKAEAGDEPEEGEQSEHDDSAAAAMRSGSSTPRGDALAALNPSAPTFRPTAGASTTTARRKRDSTAVTASDEEGEVGDGSSAAAASNSNTPRKRQRTEEGEVAGADSEEEEGSIQPAALAASESAGRSRAGTKRRR